MIVKQKIFNRKEKRALAKKSKNKIEGWMWYSNPYTSLILHVWFCTYQKSISEKEIVKRIRSMKNLPPIDDKDFIDKTLERVGLKYNDEPLCAFNSKYANGFCLYIGNEPTFIGNEPFFTNEATYYPFIHNLDYSDWNKLDLPNEVKTKATKNDIFLQIGTTIFGKLKAAWTIEGKSYDGLLAYSTSFNKNILKVSKVAFDYFYDGENPLVVESKDKKWERVFDLLNLKWVKVDTFEVDNKKRSLYKLYGYK